MSLPLLSIASGGSLVDLDGTFFIQMGIFFVMFIFLHFALFKPVMRLIAARHEATEGTSRKADMMRADAAELAAAIDKKVAEMQSAAVAERQRVIDAAREREHEILENAQDAMLREISDARAQLQESAKSARDQLEDELEQLADTVATRLISRAG